MGSYSEVHLGPLYIGGDKGGINPLVMMLFRESDKKIQTVTPADTEYYEYLNEESDLSSFEIVQYRASASIIRDRLELMGFTLDTSLNAFDAALRNAVIRHVETMSRIRSSLPDDFVDEDGAVLDELTARMWMEGLKQIRDQRLLPTHRSDATLDQVSPLLRYMLGKHFDGWYGFPGEDVRHVLRIAVEVCPNDELIYDLTDLVEGGYYDSTDDIVSDADYLLTEDFAATRRIVVLTEGATDKWILERSLKLLYPHLADFYSFMDFEGARVAGGAGALASMVKAFIGAGILNRIVALFDNDTAGSTAMRVLEQIQIPRNIVALQYPPISLASAYPTIGPNGNVEMDVNGMAGSIELYLGADVLLDNGKMMPVQWKGLDESSQRYQGEVLSKKVIHKHFESKLEDCEAQNENIQKYDWSGLHLILRHLQSAFHKVDEYDLVAIEEGVKATENK